MKKTKSIKAFLILVGLMLAVSFESKAAGSYNFGNEIADSQGLIISSAIIGGSLLIYFLAKMFVKDDDEVVKRRPKYTSNRHHRHIIKKTA